MALALPTTLKLKPCLHHHQGHTKISNTNLKFISVNPTRRRRTRNQSFVHNPSSKRGLLITRVTPDNGANSLDTFLHHHASSQEAKDVKSSSTSFGDGYVGLFVRMLGLDNDPLDREQAIVALWKYSLGGKKCIDAIMQFDGCVNLTVNLLKSQSNSTCEAAAGLLRLISSINMYRDIVADSGAIEEITGLLSRQSWTPEVKEQSLSTLWNLSVDEKFRKKIANSDLLPLLIDFLDDEDMKVKEAAGGVVANLALSSSNHNILVEAGVIPKLAKILKGDTEESKVINKEAEKLSETDIEGSNVIKRRLKADIEGSKVIKKEAKSTLLELVKDEYYKILIIEEGLIPVPLIGSDAYRSLKPDLHSWPSLPDGTKIEQTSKRPSRYGASQLLIGLNVDQKNASLDEAKLNAVLGRTRQEFLASIGAIESEDGQRSAERQITLLPWVDGVARLVLILGLEYESAIVKAADSIADASINEHIRVSFKEAGAVKHLVRLLDHKNESIKFSVTRALEKLSVSNEVCRTIEAEGVLYPLTNILKHSENKDLVDKTLNILARVLDPCKEMKSMLYNGPVNGSKNGLHAARGANTSERQNERMEFLNNDVITCLVNILKASSPDLQRKAATVLECVTVIDPSMELVLSVDIQAGLDAVFQQEVLNEMASDEEGQQPEVDAVVVEETGRAVSAAARLLTRLLESDQFARTVNSDHFTRLLRRILKSNIPLHCKNSVAACLVKLSTLPGAKVDFDNPINMEVTLYEWIPRLIEQIKTSSSPDLQEDAVIELNRIISEGVVDATQAIASAGGIFPLVQLLDEGSDRAIETSLDILYNLSMDSENHSAIMAAGAVPALRRIVLAQRPQWTQALRLLRALPT